jgi:hypothetical protein
MLCLWVSLSSKQLTRDDSDAGDIRYVQRVVKSTARGRHSQRFYRLSIMKKSAKTSMAAGTTIEASSGGTVCRNVMEMCWLLTCRSVSPPNLEEAHGIESFCKDVCRFAAPDIHPYDHVLCWSLEELLHTHHVWPAIQENFANAADMWPVRASLVYKSCVLAAVFDSFFPPIFILTLLGCPRSRLWYI